MKKLQKWIEIAFVAAFLMFLAVILAATCLPGRLGRTYSYFENRALAPRPAAEAETLLDGSFFTRLEDFLSDHVAGRNTLVKLDTLANLALGKPVVNEVVVLEDILLPWNEYESVSEDAAAESAERMAENLASVCGLVESYGGRFCYVAAPCQYAYHADRYPEYLNNREEYTRISRQALAPALEEKGVPYVDMGPIFDGLGHPDAFSSLVDNHYSICGAYQTYRAILEQFNGAGGEIPVLTEDLFSYRTVDLPYLGSRTRKLLNLLNVDERLLYLELNEDVPFVRFDDGAENVPFLYSFPGGADEWVTYSFYMGGDVSQTRIDTGREDLPSVLIYGDSFTNAVECILWWSFDEMHSLDMRYYSGSLGGYIETYQPDYVVCVRDYEALLLETGNGAGVE